MEKKYKKCQNRMSSSVSAPKVLSKFFWWLVIDIMFCLNTNWHMESLIYYIVQMLTCLLLFPCIISCGCACFVGMVRKTCSSAHPESDEDVPVLDYSDDSEISSDTDSDEDFDPIQRCAWVYSHPELLFHALFETTLKSLNLPKLHGFTLLRFRIPDNTEYKEQNFDRIRGDDNWIGRSVKKYFEGHGMFKV